MRKSVIAAAILLASFTSLTANAANKLYAETNLQKGEYLVSNNNLYSLVMQGDGNLVVYNNRRSPPTELYSTNSTGWYTRMQIDGNLVVYNQNGSWNWTSGTGNKPYDPNSFLILNDDGSIEIHHGNAVIWRRGGDPQIPPTCGGATTPVQYPVKSYTSLGQCFQSVIVANCRAEAQYMATQTGQVLGTCP